MSKTVSKPQQNENGQWYVEYTSESFDGSGFHRDFCSSEADATTTFNWFAKNGYEVVEKADDSLIETVAVETQTTTDEIISEFKATFEGSERQQSIAKVWGCGIEKLSYETLDPETLVWMNEALREKAEISESRFRSVYSKRGKSQEWIEANVRDAIVRGLDTEEHFIWLAELAHRAAPNNKEAQRWMIS